MAIVTQIQREVALLVAREPRNDFVFFMREVAQLGELATVTPVTVAREVAQLNDYATNNLLPLLRETAFLATLVSRSVSWARTDRDVARLRSSVTYGVRSTELVAEVAQLNDNADGSARPSLRDTAIVRGAAYPTAVVRRSLLEQAKLRGAAVTGAGLVVREVASLLDASTPGVQNAGLLREVAQLSDSSAGNLLVSVVERDVFYTPRNAVISPVGLFILHFIQRAREVAYLDSRIQSTGGVTSNQPTEPPPDTSVPGAGTTPTPQPFGYGTAYTCSIASWGMSTFSNFPFKTMAGKFAAGDNLWRLDADDDYGVPIKSYIKTGILDLGTSKAKRLSAVYAAGSSDGPLTVSVTADVDGVRETYDYDMEMRDQSDYRNNRALVGKGFRGRFAQFKIGGSAVKYTLLTAEADVAVSTRRL